MSTFGLTKVSHSQAMILVYRLKTANESILEVQIKLSENTNVLSIDLKIDRAANYANDFLRFDLI
jgi:hypothetical protein